MKRDFGPFIKTPFMSDELNPSQLDGSASDATAQDTGADEPRQSADSNEQGANGSNLNKTPLSFDELEKRHNGFMSRYRKDTSAWQSKEAQYEQQIQQGQMSSKELADRVAQLEQLLQQQQKPNTDPDFSSMDGKTYTEFVKKQAVDEALKAWEDRQNKERETEELSRQEEQRKKEEDRYQSRWKELMNADPTVDVRAVEKFAMENRVYDPVFAYNLMYSDDLKAQAVAQGKREAVEKIASNHKNQTEGTGKTGIAPPPAAGSQKFNSRRERNDFIVSEFQRRQSAQPTY